MSESHKLVVDLRARATIWRIPERIEDQLVAQAPPGWTVQVVRTDTISDGDGGHAPSPESLTAMADAEVYFGFGIPQPLFVAGKRLRWVHTATAGVGTALFPEMRASDVLLTNSAGVHAIPMAEYVVAGLLHFWRGFDLTQEAQRERQWARDAFVSVDTPVREAGENTVVVIGTGGVGVAAAIRLTSLGATCLGVRRRVTSGAPAGFKRVVALDGLDALLPEADAVVLCAPLTPETRGVLSADRLDRLPAHAVVVNVARGALVDEAALTKRLLTGRLRGAVLDVFQHEPLAPDSPLWQLRRSLVTPHISAVTPRRFWDREVALFRDNWNRYIAATPLRNLVNKDAGY